MIPFQGVLSPDPEFKSMVSQGSSKFRESRKKLTYVYGVNDKARTGKMYRGSVP